MSYTLPMIVNARFADAMSILHPEVTQYRDYTLETDSNGNTLLNYWDQSFDPPDDAAVTAALLTFDWNAVRAKQSTERLWTDLVFVRCSKAAIAYPAEFSAYDAAIEAVLTQTDPSAITWPTRPAVPSGVTLL